MSLNYDKCKVMHFGKKNPRNEFTMLDGVTGKAHILIPTETERDLGITLSVDAKWHEHVRKVAAKANSLLGWMKKAFMCRDVALWSRLYTTYIRPHLEFAAPAWSPHMRADFDRLERVQRRATKVMHDLKRFDYSTRLVKLNLSTLEERRKRGDLIQFFKLVNGIEKINWRRHLTIIAPARGRRARFERELVPHCGQRHNFFTNRVANECSSLPDWVVEFDHTDKHPVNKFKNAFDRFKRGEVA